MNIYIELLKTVSTRQLLVSKELTRRLVILSFKSFLVFVWDPTLYGKYDEAYFSTGDVFSAFGWALVRTYVSTISNNTLVWLQLPSCWILNKAYKYTLLHFGTHITRNFWKHPFSYPYLTATVYTRANVQGQQITCFGYDVEVHKKLYFPW